MTARDELPPYPGTPPGRPRLRDPATVEAARRYWEAARERAARRGDRAGAATAAALAESFRLAAAPRDLSEP
jgi:hypothetical protein